ncbi:hypothetical protein EYW49_20745 [Siculibacillus lacustris]|uniref:Uncharacterized protein n=1 Tax=Siculibacillus lacustris TaxID=1549641 RepID=A0A4Q9VEP9_9HYPH|nr:hypothetical protein [Siculibacillus lacustris]TBW33284.1 hypothetical protein EYW49_20745 [Siculibacillus lacustris]
MPLSEIAIVVKDVLRGVRYLFRHSSGPHLPPPLPGLGTLTTIGDTLVHRLADTVAGRNAGEGAGSRVESALRDLATLAGQARDDVFVERFRSATYVLAKEVLALRGVGNALVSEYAFTSAARSPHLAKAERNAATFCAGVTLAITAAAPVNLIDLPEPCARDPLSLSPNSAVACAIGLATTAWMDKRGEVAGAECLASAVEMIVPLHARMATAMGAPQPMPALAGLFAEYAPFIP